MVTETAAAAKAWLAKGRAIVPIPARSKAPVLRDWPSLRITEETIADYFNGAEQNVGVLLGEPSGGLVDVDLDCEEAVAAAGYFLPDTFVYGRQKRPASHRLYICPGIGTRKFQHDGTILEIRSTGCQSLIPPSTHPDGDKYERDSIVRSPAIEIAAEELTTACSRLAAAALVARNWPDGGRHDLSLALAGALLHGGLGGDDVETFVAAVAQAAGDDEPADRIRAARDTARDHAAGKPVTGWPTLGKLLPAGVVEKLREWLEIRDFPELITKKPPKAASCALVSVDMSTVKARPLDPVWDGFLWAGKPTLLVGDPGKGKSLVTLDIAARISTGEPWPCSEERRAPANVMLISAEDDVEDTIKPRLTAAGADHTRIRFVEGVRDADGGIDWLSFEKHYQQIAAGIAELRPRLIIVDPLSAYMGNADSHNEGDVRKILAGVAELARQSRSAVLAVRHFKKGGADTAQGRVIGSVAFTAAARAVYGVTPDPEEEEKRLLLCLKCNLAADTTGYSFRVITDVSGTPCIEWSAEREYRSAEEVFGITDTRSSAEAAADWLEVSLSGGPVPQKSLEKEAKAAGHSWRSVERAKAALGVESVREGGVGAAGYWQWRLKGTSHSHAGGVSNTAGDKAASPATTFGGVREIGSKNNDSSVKGAIPAKPCGRVGGVSSDGVTPNAAGVTDKGGDSPAQAALPVGAEYPHPLPCLNCKGKGCRHCDPQIRAKEDAKRRNKP
jgi:hypothetical protein